MTVSWTPLIGDGLPDRVAAAEQLAGAVVGPSTDDRAAPRSLGLR